MVRDRSLLLRRLSGTVYSVSDRSSTSLAQFRKSLKTEVFTRSFCYKEISVTLETMVELTTNNYRPANTSLLTVFIPVPCDQESLSFLYYARHDNVHFLTN